MKKIAVLGVGRSSHYLLEYLNSKSREQDWKIVACDLDKTALDEKIREFDFVEGRELNIENHQVLGALIEESDVVVSLLPPALHVRIAELCLLHSRHLATASYISPPMRVLDAEAKNKKLVFINECGLDPGIDHMSAMKIIDDLKSKGAEIFSFESYCGGLISEEDSGENPWKYKFSWNPMNVVLAGQGGDSQYLEHGEVRRIAWRDVFNDSRVLNIAKLGSFDAYPNRDSLSYMPMYGLENVSTFLRGTLRRLNYCKAWNVLVQLGFTDNEKVLVNNINSVDDFICSITQKPAGQSFSSWLVSQGLIHEDLIAHFDFLTSETGEVQLHGQTTAARLLQWLSVKWKLEENDKDEVVMFHRIGYRLNGNDSYVESSMDILGRNAGHTAMAKTVGLPLAMAVEHILTSNTLEYGVQAPISQAWYRPLLAKLELEGIAFKERHF